MENDYLKIGTAKDLRGFDGKLYRFFEMLPGILSFGIIFLAIFFSFELPVWVAFFIILYDVYWLLRTFYFAGYLKSSYSKMKENEKKDWIKELDKHEGWKDIYHLIILPMYKEPIELVRNTFRCLDRCDYPKDRMIVVLGCEKREEERARELALKIQEEFGHKFFKFLITCHPDGLKGEIPGHGSNGTWATKQAKEEIIDKLNIPIENVIVSSFDIDCCVPPKYFSILTHLYLTAENPTRTSYQPIPLYLNNIWQTPPVSRIFSWSSTFWQSMNQERPEKLVTFSSHSMSLKALVDVGYKQTNVVSDDSRIFWQCWFKYKGDYRTMPMFYPVSMDANCGETFTQTLRNIYKQQKRWAYGAGEIPYFLLRSIKDKEISLRKKISMGFYLIEGHISWAVSSILIFLLGWLPLFLGGVEFSQTLLSYNLPKITSMILTVTMLGLIISIYTSMLLLPPKPEGHKKIRYVGMVLEWVLIPFVMIFFSALPALHAQWHWLTGKYMGFWVTPKVRKD